MLRQIMSSGRIIFSVFAILLCAQAQAQSYAGLKLGMSQKEVEAIYGALSPDASSSYQNAYQLPPARVSLKDLMAPYALKQVELATVYFDAKGLLWSMYLTTKPGPVKGMYQEYRQLRSDLLVKYQLVQEVFRIPTRRSVEPNNCNRLQFYTDKDLAKRFGKVKWNVARNKLKKLDAEESDNWQVACGTEYMHSLFALPEPTQLQIAVTPLGSNGDVQDNFEERLQAFVNGEPLGVSLEFLVARYEKDVPSLAAMRKKYAKPELN